MSKHYAAISDSLYHLLFNTDLNPSIKVASVCNSQSSGLLDDSLTNGLSGC